MNSEAITLGQRILYGEYTYLMLTLLQSAR